jgi:hypothetical protein
MNLWKIIVGLSWKFCLFVLGLYGLLKLFKETRLFNLNIPDWVFFLWLIFFSLVLVITVNFVNKSRGAATDDSGQIKEIEKLEKSLIESKKEVHRLEVEFRDKINKQGVIIAQIYNAPTQHLKLEPNDEILFILETLANKSSQAVVWSDLQYYYLQNFDKAKTLADYNIVINKLETYGYIRLEVRAEPEQYEITSKGIEYFALVRKKE